MESSIHEKVARKRPDIRCKIENLSRYASEPILSCYSGTAGMKACYVIGGGPWMIKFPRMTDPFAAPFSIGPVAEYIGSKNYESLEIDVHKVRLGAMDAAVQGEGVSTVIVAMCEGISSLSPIVSYGDVKSSLGGELFPSSSNGSSPSISASFARLMCRVLAIFTADKTGNTRDWQTLPFFS